MLEVRLVVRSRRKQDRERTAAILRRPVRQAVAQRGEELREVLHLEVAEKLRESARDDDPVLERIAGARGRLGAVVDHPPAAVGRTGDVCRVDVQHHLARSLRPVAGAHEPGVPVDQRRRQQAFAEQALLAVNVDEDLVEQRRALHDRRLDPAPLLLRQDHRQEIQLPRAVGALRIGVHVVGDAVLAHLAVHRVQPLAHALGRPGRELLDHRLPVLARRIRRLEQLVVAFGSGLIFAEQLAGHPGAG